MDTCVVDVALGKDVEIDLDTDGGAGGGAGIDIEIGTEIIANTLKTLESYNPTFPFGPLGN